MPSAGDTAPQDLHTLKDGSCTDSCFPWLLSQKDVSVSSGSEPRDASLPHSPPPRGPGAVRPLAPISSGDSGDGVPGAGHGTGLPRWGRTGHIEGWRAALT